MDATDSERSGHKKHKKARKVRLEPWQQQLRVGSVTVCVVFLWLFAFFVAIPLVLCSVPAMFGDNWSYFFFN
jgi:hypothetical protein